MNQNAILPDNGSPARLLLRLPICDKTLSSEESHDFTLPDYLPEIRKMLRVTVSIDEPESYASASDVEFSGGLTYHVLYTGADGAPRRVDREWLWGLFRDGEGGDGEWNWSLFGGLLGRSGRAGGPSRWRVLWLFGSAED